MSTVQRELQALRQRFIEGLPARLEYLEQGCAALATGDCSHVSELHRAAHSLVGAAGIHGLMAVAEAAAALEASLQDARDLAAVNAALAALAKAVVRPDAPLPEEPPAPPADGRRVAVVCRETEDRASQSRLLEAAGYAVSAFSAPAPFEAWLAQGTEPDLVVLALQFDAGDGDGLGVLARLHALRPHLPVVIASSRRDAVTRLSAYRAGACHFLGKPFAPDDFLSVVDEACDDGTPGQGRVLLAGPDGAALAALAQALASQDIAADTVCELHALPEAVAAGAVDAVIFHHPGAVMPPGDLLRLLRDDPRTAGVPRLWLTDRRDPAAEAMALEAGCAQVCETDTGPTALARLVRLHARRAQDAKRRADRLRTSEYEYARQREALDRHAIISVADAAGVIVETSARHADLSGFPLEELIGSHLAEARSGKAPPELAAEQWQEAARGKVWQGECRLSRRDGTSYWVETTLVPFLDPAGQVYRHVVVRTDITRRKEGEIALAAAREAEMAIAGQIQETLLLPPVPACPAGVSVASRFAASRGVAGDFSELVELGPDCFDVVIGDVMGKGVPAALVGAAVKLELARCLLELRSRHGNAPPAPEAIVNALHARLTPRLIALDCFVTLAYLRCDRGRGELIHIGCGHPETLIVGPQGVRAVAGEHLPLGVLPQETYAGTRLPWEPGASIVLCSDGLTEAADAQGERLEAERFAHIAADAHAASWSAQEVAAHIFDGVRRFAGDDVPADDQTLMVLRLPAPAECFHALPRSLASLAPLRVLVREACARHGMGEDGADQLEIACVEVFSNIARHADATGGDPTVSLVIGERDGRMQLGFAYAGEPFECSGAPEIPDVDAMPEGGFGLYLIHATCDAVHFGGCAGVARCRLEKGIG